MEMNKYGMSAVALLGALLLGNGQAQASETVNTILGGGVGGVAGTMIGKQLGGDTGALVGAAVGGAAGGAATAWLMRSSSSAMVSGVRVTSVSSARGGGLGGWCGVVGVMWLLCGSVVVPCWSDRR